MSNLKHNPIARMAAICALLFVILLPSAAFAGQRREDNRRGSRRSRAQYNWKKHQWKKRAKFVNGHDARDGRWDKRRFKRNVSSDDSLYGRRGRDNGDRRENRGRDDDFKRGNSGNRGRGKGKG